MPSGFDAPGGDDWRTGDSVTFAMDFEDGPDRTTYWLVMEVTKTPVGLADSPRALVKTTLYAQDGTELGTAKRRIDPQRITDASQEVLDSYNGLVNAAMLDEPADKIQDKIDEEMTEGSIFSDARRAVFRELKKTMGPRFVRESMKDAAIKSTIGSINLFDIAMSAVAPPEVLVDVNQLKDEQAGVHAFSDIPVPTPIRVPFVVTLGGAIQFRFAVTLTRPLPPYSLSGGIIEVGGVNEFNGEKRCLLRIVSAKRGQAPESRPD